MVHLLTSDQQPVAYGHHRHIYTSYDSQLRLYSPVSGGLTSSFEADFDGWTTSTFLRKVGSTTSTSTGPPSAAVGSYYVYCETSAPNFPSANFDMSRIVTVGSVSGLTFQYHMYGAAMGTATLEAYTGAGWISAWTKSGNLGNAWQQASVTVASGTTMLSFKYTGESSYTGDFALDDIQSTGGYDTHSYSYSYGDLCACMLYADLSD